MLESKDVSGSAPTSTHSTWASCALQDCLREMPPGNRPIYDPLVRSARSRLFGSWEMNWMAYNFAQDVALPKSAREPLGFLLYPQAETADGRIDCLDPDRFKYEITSREI
jgi:hypothetical protein